MLSMSMLRMFAFLLIEDSYITGASAANDTNTVETTGWRYCIQCQICWIVLAFYFTPRLIHVPVFCIRLSCKFGVPRMQCFL